MPLILYLTDHIFIPTSQISEEYAKYLLALAASSHPMMPADVWEKILYDSLGDSETSVGCVSLVEWRDEMEAEK